MTMNCLAKPTQRTANQKHPRESAFAPNHVFANLFKRAAMGSRIALEIADEDSMKRADTSLISGGYDYLI